MKRCKQVSYFLMGTLFLLSCLFILSGCSTIKNWFSFLTDTNEVRTAENMTQKDIETFASSVRPVQGDAEYQYRLARHFQKQNRHEIAVEEFIKVLKMDPEFYNAYNAMGVSYDYLKMHDDAIDAYQSALKIKPDLDYVYNNIGYSQLLKGDLEAAALNFKKAIAMNSGNATYQNNLSLVQAKMGEAGPVLAESREAEVRAEQLETKTVQEEPVKTITAETLPQKKETIAESSEEKPEVSALKNYYAVQIGVYYDKNKAAQKMKDAVAKGYACPYVTKVEKENPYYRVRFGKYDSRDAALEVASGISDGNGRPALAVSETYPMAVFHAKKEIDCTDAGISDVALKPSVKIRVLNGNGVDHMAGRVSQYFEGKGYHVATPSNARHFSYRTTRIYYAPGYYNEALKLSKEIPGSGIAFKFIESHKLDTGIRILIGSDVKYLDSYFRKHSTI